VFILTAHRSCGEIFQSKSALQIGLVTVQVDKFILFKMDFEAQGIYFTL